MGYAPFIFFFHGLCGPDCAVQEIAAESPAGSMLVRPPRRDPAHRPISPKIILRGRDGGFNKEREQHDCMGFVTRNTYYFDAPGAQNTADAARFAVERAQELGVRKIVVASTSGRTALAFQDAMKETDLRLIVVTHVVGFSRPGEWEFSGEAAETLRAAGVAIVTGTHALSGLERAISRSPRLGGSSRTEAVAEALRRVVAVGLKVAVECVLIAADQGVVGVDEEVIAVGGTISGADTVCVIRPAHTASFFDLQVREIVAMPRVR